MRLARTWIALLFATALGLAPAAAALQGPDVRQAGPSAAQAQGQRPPSERPNASGHAGAARERWEKLSPEQRAELKQRFERFQQLGESERRELLERARRLRAGCEGAQAGSTSEWKDKFAALGPRQRHEAQREYGYESLRARGREIRDKLPQAWLERLERASPEERLALLREFKEKQLDGLCRMALARLAPLLDLSAEELARVQALPFEERGRVVLEYRKRAQELDTRQNGLPPGISDADWQALVALEPEAFFLRLKAQRERHAAERPMRDGRQERDASGPPREAPTPAQAEGMRRLLEALQPRPDEVVAVVDLPAEQRATRLAELRRARCIEVLRTHELVSAEQLEGLATLDERRFGELLRNVLRPLRSSAWRERGWGQSGSRGHDHHGNWPRGGAKPERPERPERKDDCPPAQDAPRTPGAPPASPENRPGGGR